jgi:nucleoside-diphosphate-sugar epimerase
MADRLILVTGATGYLGTATVPVLARHYPVRAQGTMSYGNPLDAISSIECVKGDIRDHHFIGKALDGVTDVVHLAGVVTDELVDMNESLSREINLDATLDLAYAAKRCGVRRFIFASAGSVYGAQNTICTEESPVGPMSAYARMKLEGESLLNSIADSSFGVCSLRIAGCCGPALRMRLDTIVNVFSKQGYYNGSITVHGGGQWRSNVHVSDVAELISLLLESSWDRIRGQVFNVSAQIDQALGIAHLVRDTISEFGATEGWGIPSPQIVVDTSMEDRRNYRLDSSKLERTLAWKPVRTITDAIIDNLRWFAAGRVCDPDQDLYYNLRRVGRAMNSKP